MNVPNRLADLRLAAGLTCAQIAERVERDPSTVYRWEIGEHRIPDDVKPQLARMLGVTVGDLMCWTEAT